MADALRVIVEAGPKGKKVVATAFDWPGLERNGKTEEEAIAQLEAYRPRYLKAAKHVRLGTAFAANGPIEIVERYDGVSSTDFWGISFASCSLDHELPDEQEWERWLKLLQGCWAEFDAVAARVSAELRKGPRGGGRDRDEIINHVFGTERVQMAPKVGLKTPQGVMLTPDGLATHRKGYLEALREAHREGRVMVGRSWTLSYLLRHTCYHLLDHAWEMEDKDLTG